jgi:hypothetical protein
LEAAPVESRQRPPLRRRPNTVMPDKVLKIDSEALMQMATEELLDFAEGTLGIAIPGNTPRTQVLQKIINAAIAIPSGLR